MHKTTGRFEKCFRRLPEYIQQKYIRAVSILNKNPKHPSLHFKKIGKFWSMRISSFYRALAVKEDDNYIWVWIGTHDDYEKMLKNK